MSARRRVPSKAKPHREKRAAQAAPPPDLYPEHPFASERAMREIHALLEGQKFESADQLNARLEELISGGSGARSSSPTMPSKPTIPSRLSAWLARL